MALSNPKRQIVPRGKIWKKNRAAVLVRDGRTCQYCRKGPLIGPDAHADHVRPLKHGGEDELWNYVTACEQCNKTKSDRWPADGDPDITIGVQQIRAFYQQRKAAFERREWLPTIQTVQTAAGAELSKEVQPKGGARGELPLETIELMWKAFLVRPSANHVCEVTGVHHKTARKYVDLGDPSRGIEPFAARLARLQLEASKRADAMFVEKRATTISLIDNLLPAMFKKLAIVNDKGEVVDLAVMPDFKDFLEVAKFREVLTGGADSRREVRHKFADMTEDELVQVINRTRERARLLDAGAGPVIDVTPAASESVSDGEATDSAELGGAGRHSDAVDQGRLDDRETGLADVPGDARPADSVDRGERGECSSGVVSATETNGEGV